MTSFLLLPYNDESAAAQINNKRNTSHKKLFQKDAFIFKLNIFLNSTQSFSNSSILVVTNIITISVGPLLKENKLQAVH